MCKATVALHWRGRFRAVALAIMTVSTLPKNKYLLSQLLFNVEIQTLGYHEILRAREPEPGRSLVRLEISATCMASHSHWTGHLPGYDDPFSPVQVVYLSFMLSYRRSPTPKDHVQQHRSRSDIVNRRS